MKRGAITTEVVNVTPEMATEWLNHNTHNRPLRHGLVERYAAIMRAGGWKLVHQGIAFTAEGDIVDGQHRLFAVIESGMTIAFNVTRGVLAETQMVIDDHAKRTVRDVAVLQRGLGEADNRHIGAARTMWVFGLGDWAGPITNQTMVEFVRKYWEGLDFTVKEVFQGRKVAGITQAAVLAVVTQAYYTGADRTRLKEFGEVLITGMPKSDADAAGALLGRFLLSKIGMGGRASQGEVYRKTQRALLSFLAKDNVVKLYEAREQLFPLPGTKKPTRSSDWRKNAIIKRVRKAS